MHVVQENHNFLIKNEMAFKQHGIVHVRRNMRERGGGRGGGGELGLHFISIKAQNGNLYLK